MSAMCQARIRSATGEKYPCRNRATRVKVIYSPMLVCGLHDRTDPSGSWGPRPYAKDVPQHLVPKYVVELRQYGDELLNEREKLQARINDNRAFIREIENAWAGDQR